MPATSSAAASNRHFVSSPGVDAGDRSIPSQRIGPSRDRFNDPRLSEVVPASHLQIRQPAAMASSGIAELDHFVGGLPRGCLTEIYGQASSGRTSLLLTALASATRRGEFCALVDAGDAFDPQSASDAGVLFQRLLWIRCGESFSKPNRENSRSRTAPKNSRLRNLDQALRTLDLLLSSGGFGLVAFDLAGVSPHLARKIPLTTWFRFRRAVETTPTILLAIEDQPLAGSCSSLLLHLSADRVAPLQPQLPTPTHAQLFPGIDVRVQSERSRLERRPTSPASFFQAKTAWAG